VRRFERLNSAGSFAIAIAIATAALVFKVLMPPRPCSRPVLP